MDDPALMVIEPLPSELHEKRRVTYHRLACRTVLNRNPNPEHPFYWTINPYRGCEIGCTYCFARYTHSFMELDDPLDFERHIYAKVEAARVLATTADAAALEGREVAIGTATDPYQSAERRFRITRSILEVLATVPTLDLSITTKSDLVLRDIDILTRIAARCPLTVHITVTTIDRDVARVLEPAAPTPEKRLETVAALGAAGIRTGVFVMPILPRITDAERQLDRLFGAACDAGAKLVDTSLLHLRDIPRRRFFPFLAEHFPQHLRFYEDAYRFGARLPRHLARPIEERVARLRTRHAFGDRRPSREARPAAAAQLSLSL